MLRSPVARTAFAAASALAVALIGAPAPARAEIVVGESLDWLVVSRPHVAVMRVVEVVESPVKGGATWTTRTVRLERVGVMKGEPPETATFERHVSVGAAPGRGAPRVFAPKENGEMLVFFRVEEGGREAGEVRVDQAIDLERPATGGLTDVAFTTDFAILDDGDTIVKTAEARLALIEAAAAKAKRDGEPPAERARPANFFAAQRGFIRFEIPYDTAAYRALWSGSSCYLVVPADHALRAEIVKATASADVHERAEAAERLLSYPDAEARAILRKLLVDPGTSRVTVHGETKETFTIYPVRQAAYETLRALGEDVEEPEGYWKD